MPRSRRGQHDAFNALPPPEFDKLVNSVSILAKTSRASFLTAALNKDQHQRLFALLVSVFRPWAISP